MKKLEKKLKEGLEKMDIKEIIALILIALALGALITLLFITAIPTAKEQQKEIKIKTKLYKALIEYLEEKKK